MLTPAPPLISPVLMTAGQLVKVPASLLTPAVGTVVVMQVEVVVSFQGVVLDHDLDQVSLQQAEFLAVVLQEQFVLV